MIFIEESTETWLEKYPTLKIIERNCDHCGKKMKSTMPFISKDYAGLRAPKCECGKNKYTAMSMVSRTEKKYIELSNELNYL